MQIRRVLFFLLLLGLFSLPLCSKEWRTWENCYLETSKPHDGDTFIFVDKGQQRIIKLYCVDAIEADARFPELVEDQAAYFGGLSEETLLNLGQSARTLTRTALSKPFTIITRLERASGNSYLPRYYALVKTATGEYLGESLLKAGLARLSGPPIRGQWPGHLKRHQFMEKLQRMERKARNERVGAWAGVPSIPENIPSQPDSPHTASAAAKTATGPAPEPVPEAAAVPDPATLPYSFYEAPLDKPRPAPGHFSLIEDPPQYTAEYYAREATNWLHKDVLFYIGEAQSAKAPAPEEFKAAQALTGYKGRTGGSILIYIHKSKYEAFMAHYGRLTTLDEHQVQTSKVATRPLKAFYHFLNGDFILVVKE